MTRIILDVPKDKMQSFIKAVLDIGISGHAISAAEPSVKNTATINLSNSLKQISQSYILFDWEFYSNELEYE
ncbi:MAG: hypothetical protein K2X37_02970 [Chitinophagaceae bacterium]|nr:hypothetical protein [Chitinophagaceae bacterium]